MLLAILETVIITPAVAYAYPEGNAKLFAYSVLINNIVFPLVFGIPIAIIMQEELGFKHIPTECACKHAMHGTSHYVFVLTKDERHA